MLIQFLWPGLWGEEPGVADFVDVSGDPDAPVLRGVVSSVKHEDETEGPVLGIILQDGQPGAQELQEWIENDGDLGLALSANQRVG